MDEEDNEWYYYLLRGVLGYYAAALFMVKVKGQDHRSQVVVGRVVMTRLETYLTGGRYYLAGDLTRGCDVSGRSYTWQSVGWKTLHVA